MTVLTFFSCVAQLRSRKNNSMASQSTVLSGLPEAQIPGGELSSTIFSCMCMCTWPAWPLLWWFGSS